MLIISINLAFKTSEFISHLLFFHSNSCSDWWKTPSWHSREHDTFHAQFRSCEGHVRTDIYKHGAVDDNFSSCVNVRLPHGCEWTHWRGKSTLW